MEIDNEELLRKLVRTGMIMRHLEEGGPHRHCHHGAKQHGETGTDSPDDSRQEGHHHAFGHGGQGHGQRYGQARVLTMVSMKEGINQKDLAFLLGIRPQTIGELLRKLEERELVERRKSSTDGRAVQLYLTDAGRAKAAEISQRRAIAAADVFSVLDDDEKLQLDAILDKLSVELDSRRPRKHEGERRLAH